MIFDYVHQLNDMADACENDRVLRLSLDTKARVKIGRFGRGGYSRVAVKALDHDFEPDAILVPVGIAVPKYDEVYIDLCHDRAPADAWVDSLEHFWQQQGHRFPNTTHLVLNLDNGPENNSHRTQFMARLVQFADKTGLTITLAYYPPYHSKYNFIERCWGVLENVWRGHLLDCVEAVVAFASKMRYNGVQAVVRLVDKVYEQGVRLPKAAMAHVEQRLDRDEVLPKYRVTITPAALRP